MLITVSNCIIQKDLQGIINEIEKEDLLHVIVPLQKIGIIQYDYFQIQLKKIISTQGQSTLRYQDLRFSKFYYKFSTPSQ